MLLHSGVTLKGNKKFSTHWISSTSLKKQPKFSDNTTETSGEIPVLMTFYYPDLDSASDCLTQIFHANQKHYPNLVVARHNYEFSALLLKTSFRGGTCGGVIGFFLRLFKH